MSNYLTGKSIPLNLQIKEDGKVKTVNGLHFWRLKWELSSAVKAEDIQPIVYESSQSKRIKSAAIITPNMCDDEARFISEGSYCEVLTSTKLPNQYIKARVIRLDSFGNSHIFAHILFDQPFILHNQYVNYIYVNVLNSQLIKF
jgi:hypothetical protein